MRRFFSFAILLCGAAVLASLPAGAAAGGEPKAQGTGPTAVLKGLDPVLLTKGKEVAGDKSFDLVHKGFRYRFASAENRKLFEREPGHYEIQLNGMCAAMPQAEGDPNLFAVHKGLIYIFGTPKCRATFTAQPAKFVKERKNVAIFVHEGVELLDFAGPAEVFAAAGGGKAFNVYTVAVSEELIVSQRILTIKPQYTLENCPKPDLIVLPGGNTRIPLKDARVIDWIKKSASDAEVMLSVCTGAFLLAKAGLLDGKEATTHWGAIDRLKKEAPKTTVHANRRFVDNGKIVTTAGVSAGIDGSLHIVERLLGSQAAIDTARYMEYRWEPGADKKADR